MWSCAGAESHENGRVDKSYARSCVNDRSVPWTSLNETTNSELWSYAHKALSVCVHQFQSVHEFSFILHQKWVYDWDNTCIKLGNSMSFSQDGQLEHSNIHDTSLTISVPHYCTSASIQGLLKSANTSHSEHWTLLQYQFSNSFICHFCCYAALSTYVHVILQVSVPAYCSQYMFSPGLFLLYNFHRIGKKKKAPPWAASYT